MPTNILMPALSPTMEKGNLAKWLKKEGDQIKSGDVIAEIETDKATMEVEAVDEGVLAKIVVPEGTADVPVNDVIAVIAGEGEDAKAVGAAGAAPTAKKADEKPKDEAPKQEEKAAPAPASTNGSGQRAPQAAATPAPQPQAQTNGAGVAGMALQNRCGTRLPAHRTPYPFIWHRSLPLVTGRSALARKAPSRHTKPLQFPSRC